jgi:hypothetical protein
LFDFKNFKLSLDYQPAVDPSLLENNFSGMAKYSGEILGVKNPHIPFNFQNNQFSLSGWAVAQDGDGHFNLADGKLTYSNLLSDAFANSRY